MSEEQAETAETSGARRIGSTAVLVRTGVFFLVLAAASHVLLTRQATWEHFLLHHNEGLAKVCATLLSPLAEGVRSSGIRISSPRFAVQLVLGCDGLDALAILIAGILAFPVSWRERAKGLAIGIPVVYAANVFRIVVLFLLGTHVPKLFDLVHVYVFQVFIVAVAAGTFLAWAWRSLGRAPSP